MTNSQIDILKKALLKVGLDEVEKCKNLPDEDFAFSDNFENNIQKIAKKRRSFTHTITKTIPRKIAVIFIAAIITFTFMMSISAIRIPVINFFVNVYEDFISIFIEEEENTYIPDTIENISMPSYMIDGFYLIDSQNFGRDAESCWINNDDCTIVLYQSILEQEFKTYIDNEDMDYQEISINSQKVYYSNRKGECIIMWTDNTYLFSLLYPEEVSFDEITKIIESF